MKAGLCECGCGGATALSTRTDKRHGAIKGQPRRFIKNHAGYRGGRSVRKDGYVYKVAHGHPRADKIGRVLEHILFAEAALGKPLPPKAVVHHSDERQGQVDPRGLVICPDENYHRLIHQRSRALKASGHADWRKCNICKSYDDPSRLYVYGTHAYHVACKTINRKVVSGKKMLREIRPRLALLEDIGPVAAAIDAYLDEHPQEAAKAPHA